MEKASQQRLTAPVHTSHLNRLLVRGLAPANSYRCPFDFPSFLSAGDNSCGSLQCGRFRWSSIEWSREVCLED